MMKKLLVVRNDKLGDLILIFPALKLIRNSINDIQIDCLIDKKFTDIRTISNYIDNAIYDNAQLVNEIKRYNYDFVISFFSTFNIGYKLYRSAIAKRYAPATKLAQIFYNRTIKQNRSLSVKPEYEYNLDLAKYFLKDNGYNINDSNSSYFSLTKTKDLSNEKKQSVFIHPYTGGSSKSLAPRDFIKLCEEINNYKECNFTIHCDVHDYDKCLKLEKINHNLNIKTINPTESLIQMFNNINKCDIFIAGSTGPLHVAAALGKKTVGFYPSKISSTSLRWSTINPSHSKLSFTDIGNNNEYIEINLIKAAKLIYDHLLD